MTLNKTLINFRYIINLPQNTTAQIDRYIICFLQCIELTSRNLQQYRTKKLVVASNFNQTHKKFTTMKNQMNKQQEHRLK